jgi:putative transcription factor
MSDDRENQVHIGSNVHGRGGGGPRSIVVKGNAALSAAKRNGGVTTEKKYGSANSVSVSPFHLD